ncbi:hypothetical protein RhiJN_03770 [Ceratobasidium sp. AG-Ba]|nr:hypothetical protein RhiJN_03770 [Ceratobasidium sp. AG-Ba]QRW04661.1 hypothetical protein RhiLY_03660 [Ceratobasidium sp. AG-Ba]
MSDIEDRRKADSFETELRRKAELDPGNEWELIWFLRLPLETRCSYMRILEARIDQDKHRQYLFRQSCYRQRNWRESRSSHTIKCMNVEVAQPWASIGRRQHRRKYNLRSSFRQRQAHDRRPHPQHVRFQFPALRGSTSPVMVDPDAVPERPMTPPGLRDSITAHEPLGLEASGIDPLTGQYKPTPTPADTPVSSAPPTPPSAVEEPPLHIEYPPGPLFRPPGRYRAANGPVDMDLAFVVSVGQYHRAPWDVGEFPMADATLDIAQFDAINLGIISSLADLLFPKGTNKPIHAVPAVNQVLFDLIIGWLVLPLARANGFMPSPWQRCSCGEGVVMT